MYVYILLTPHSDPNSIVFAPTKPTSNKSTFCKGAQFPSAKKAALWRRRLIGSVGRRRIGGSISRGTIVLGGSIRRRIGRSIGRTVGWRTGISVLDWGLGGWVLVHGTLGWRILIRRGIVCCMDGSPGKGQKRKEEDFHHGAGRLLMFRNSINRKNCEQNGQQWRRELNSSTISVERNHSSFICTQRERCLHECI
jgi:hypothetical protein